MAPHSYHQRLAADAPRWSRHATQYTPVLGRSGAAEGRTWNRLRQAAQLVGRRYGGPDAPDCAVLPTGDSGVEEDILRDGSQLLGR